VPEPIDMPKRNNLGYAEEEFLGEYVGMRAGLEVWIEEEGKVPGHARALFVTVVDRSLVDKDGMPRVAMQIDLSSQGNSWHVDIARTDSRYKGRNLAVRVYVLLMKKRRLALKAGTAQSIGGRKLWNRLNRHPDILVYARKSKRSSNISLVKSGRYQLSCESFDLYDDNAAAEIFATVAG